MFRITLHSLWSHKRRLISTCVAVVLGVAFMAGTLVLSGTINRVFDDLFAGLSEGTDAVVRGEVIQENDQTGTQRALLDEAVTQQVRDVPGVAAVEPSVGVATYTLLDHRGEVLGGNGPPTIVGSWGHDDRLNSYRVVEGRAPEADDEAILDRAATDNGDFRVGDEMTLIGPTGRVNLKLVGVSMFGDADSAGGSIFVGTTLAKAQELSGEPGKVNEIYARAEPGITDTELVTRIRAADLAPGADVVTGKQAAAEQASDVKTGFSFFSIMLLVFAAVALFVGGFIISNTFGILVAQRTKELALLRAVGASRRQVMGSVILEAVLIGLFSAVVGFVAGIALAWGALKLLANFGLDMPNASLAVTPTTAITAMVVGMGITLIAAFMPAVRATRVPPIAALRDVAVDTSGRSRLRGIGGVVLLLLGAALVSPAFRSDQPDYTLKATGLGMAMLILGVLVLGPVLARPLSRVVGGFLPALKGVTGTIARENAMRSPRRTASTAAALIIGVTLVGFITVFAASAQESVRETVGSGFNGDFIVRPVNQFSVTGAPPALGEEIRGVKGVDAVSAMAASIVKLEYPDGGETAMVVAGIDDDYGRLWNVETTEGPLGALPANGAVLSKDLSTEHDLPIGSTFTAVGEDNRTVELEVVALVDEPLLLGPVAISRDAATKLAPQVSDFWLAIELDKGTSVEEARPAIEKLVDAYPTMRLQDRDQFTQGIVQQISVMLNVIYALLAVSIIIALIGIANTLSLSIHERTRELGLLRAMGMTRSQLRSTVRWEAVIVALLGTGIGLVLGIGLSWILVKALESQGITAFQIPVGGMIAMVIFGAGLGILASVRPSWRASKLNVLEAIASE